MESAIFIVIITINIWHCAGNNSSNEFKSSQLRLHDSKPSIGLLKTSASVPYIVFEKDLTNGRDALQRSGKTLIIAILQSLKKGKSKDHNMPTKQIDRRSPLSFERPSEPKMEDPRMQQSYYYPEQKRSSSLMNLPINEFMKTYERLETALEKAQAAGTLNPYPETHQTPLLVSIGKWLRPRLAIADINRWKNVPVGYFIRNYERLRSEVEGKQSRQDFLSEYQRKQTLYNSMDHEKPTKAPETTTTMKPQQPLQPQKPQQPFDPTLADIPIESLLKEYHKLEQEIERRKTVLQSFRENNRPSINNNEKKTYAAGGQKDFNEFMKNVYPEQPPSPAYVQPKVTTEFSQPYHSDSELATLYRTPQNGPGDEVLLNENMGEVQYNPYRSGKETKEVGEPYRSDEELATLYRPENKTKTGVIKWEPSNKLIKSVEALRMARSRDSAEDLDPDLFLLRPRGIVSYFRRTPYKDMPQKNQKSRPWIKKYWKRRHINRKKAASYAYVDLERLEEVISRFRRQRPLPPRKKTIGHLHDEPHIVSSLEVAPVTTAATPAPKMEWFYNTADAYNHIKIDADAPDITELMPNFKLENDKKWWFYHQNDHTSFKEY